MKLAVGAVDEEEYVGALIVWCAEENGTVRAAKCQKRFRNEIFVVEFHVQKRGAAADCRRCRLFTFGKALEKRILVVNQSSGVGKLRHVAQHSASVLCCEERGYRFFGKKVGYVDFTGSFRPFVHCMGMFAGKLLW